MIAENKLKESYVLCRDCIHYSISDFISRNANVTVSELSIFKFFNQRGFIAFLIEILKNLFFGVCYTYSAAAATFPRELSTKADFLVGSLEHFQMADVRGLFSVG